MDFSMKVLPVADRLSILSYSDLVAELEKKGSADLGGTDALTGSVASPLIDEGCAGIPPSPEPEPRPNAFTLLDVGASSVAGSVQSAVDKALATW